MNNDPVIPKKTRARTKKKVHQLRVKSKLEFNKFEKNIPQLIQLLKSHSVTNKLTFSSELIKDPLSPKIRFKYGKNENQSETEITIEPGSFEFDFEDGFNKIDELTAYKASKLLQKQIINEVNTWYQAITLFTFSESNVSHANTGNRKSAKKSLKQQD